MCGFAGFFTTQAGVLSNAEAVVTRMAAAIAHRGPDDAGAWVDAEAGIALGHRRLSIVDLSAAGHQPMHSGSGRFVMAFNGEVYNHLELRAELGEPNAPWRGHSDTETLLAAFEQWGIDATLQRAVGMFAIALWDRHERVLHLTRDRCGEKPLYYGWTGESNRLSLVFGSELKALRAWPGFANPIDREALALYLRFNYVPTPLSIHQGVFKLEPGCRLSISSAGVRTRPTSVRAPIQQAGLSIHRWWSLESAVLAGAASPFTDEAQAFDALDAALRTAVRQQSLADVPLGAFLSGGVDSSLIVALMQAQSARPIKTFTVGFDEAGFDESAHAQAVARHLGTDHTELRVSVDQARGVIPSLPTMYDEPFADSSQIPTHLVCAAARQHVTVALSGDAGDELFGGYNRYVWGPRLWQRLRLLPYGARQALSVLLLAAPLDSLDRLAGRLKVLHPAEKLRKVAKAMQGVHDIDDLYAQLVSEWPDPRQVMQGMPASWSRPGILLDDPVPRLGLASAALRMMYRDTLTYMPDDILCKVDRAAMATSLETRVPFLDHRVIELAWRLPLNMKLRDGQGKWALRQILYRHVPQALIDRPKAGFRLPIGQWLQGPLRDWAEHLLSETRLRSEGYFQAAVIRKTWSAHLSGRSDHTTHLWNVLMFQAWLDAQSTPHGAP